MDWVGVKLNAVPENSHVYFPNGVYGQSDTIYMKKGWAVKGDGRTESIIKSSVSGDAF